MTQSKSKLLPWFRMYSEAVDDPKLKLVAYEDRWHFVALLCCKCQGLLDRSDDAMVRRMVAVKLGLDLRELDEVARRLSEVELIDRDTLQPLSWDARQFKSDTSTDRVRRHREKQKKQTDREPKRGCNVSETAPDTETETETEPDTETENVKSKSAVALPHAKSNQAKRPAQGHRLPDDWAPSDQLLEWAADTVPSVDVRTETETFCDHWRAQPGAKGRKADWDATWRNWMRRALGFGGGRPGPRGADADRGAAGRLLK